MKILTCLFVLLPILLPIDTKQKSWVQTWNDVETNGRNIFWIQGEWIEDIRKRRGFEEFARARGGLMVKNWNWRKKRPFTMTLKAGSTNGDPHLDLRGDPGPLAEKPRDHNDPQYHFIIRPDNFKEPNKFYLNSALDKDEPGGYTGRSKLTTPCSGCLQLDIVVKTQYGDTDLKIKIVYRPAEKGLLYKTTDYSNGRKGRVLTQILYRKKDPIIPLKYCRMPKKNNPPWQHPQIERACKLRSPLNEKEDTGMDNPNCRPTHMCLRELGLKLLHYHHCRETCDLCGDHTVDCREFKEFPEEF